MSEGAARCRLCNEPIASTAGDDRPYCSPGCRRVDQTLDGGESVPVNDRANRADQPSDGAEAETERAYLHIDGMHCATCEAFLERRATNCDGVVDAAASYVT
ncbi:MAG: Cu2+-exporting ATPase, partial [Natronomonas sp.]